MPVRPTENDVGTGHVPGVQPQVIGRGLVKG